MWVRERSLPYQLMYIVHTTHCTRSFFAYRWITIKHYDFLWVKTHFSIRFVFALSSFIIIFERYLFVHALVAKQISRVLIGFYTARRVLLCRVFGHFFHKCVVREFVFFTLYLFLSVNKCPFTLFSSFFATWMPPFRRFLFFSAVVVLASLLFEFGVSESYIRAWSRVNTIFNKDISYDSNGQTNKTAMSKSQPRNGLLVIVSQNPFHAK